MYTSGEIQYEGDGRSLDIFKIPCLQNGVSQISRRNVARKLISSFSNKHGILYCFWLQLCKFIRNMHCMLFGRPYYRSCLWHTMSCVVCRLSVTFCIVAKRYVLAKNRLKEWIGNQGQKVDFWGRRHIYTSGFAAMATKRPFLHYYCPYSPACSRY